MCSLVCLWKQGDSESENRTQGSQTVDATTVVEVWTSRMVVMTPPTLAGDSACVAVTAAPSTPPAADRNAAIVTAQSKDEVKVDVAEQLPTATGANRGRGGPSDDFAVMNPVYNDGAAVRLGRSAA